VRGNGNGSVLGIGIFGCSGGPLDGMAVTVKGSVLEGVMKGS